MPWYRNGTVAVTAGQTTVTGTNTDFALNARVGDAFQGPDGRWYEVANIASASVLGILPAYQGDTVAAGVYGLAPMQGYVKESADRLRQLVEQWGSTLAALGAVATEDVVPVAKGGTGGTTQATALTGLGATSVGSALFTAADAAAVRAAAGATSTGSSLLTASTPAVARTALQLKSAALADIVGTVSQAGGVPTGAIFEAGSNSNGNYVKFADGTMICTFTSSTAQTTSTPSGSIFIGTNQQFTFPAAFAAVPRVTPNCTDVAVAVCWVGGGGSVSSTGCVFWLVSAVSGASARVMYIAVGRWF